MLNTTITKGFDLQTSSEDLNDEYDSTMDPLHKLQRRMERKIDRSRMDNTRLQFIKTSKAKKL